MGRKRKWQGGETTAIRVPTVLVDRLLSQARAWDSAAESVESLTAADQTISPLNPCRVRFGFRGQSTEGRAVGVLINWPLGTVSAVLINWIWEGDAKQTQLPIHQVEFLDLPEFCKKIPALPWSYPPQLVTVSDKRGERCFRLPGGTLSGEETAIVDQELDRLLEECERIRLDPLILLQGLCEKWLEPIEQSA